LKKEDFIFLGLVCANLLARWFVRLSTDLLYICSFYLLFRLMGLNGTHGSYTRTDDVNRPVNLYFDGYNWGRSGTDTDGELLGIYIKGSDTFKCYTDIRFTDANGWDNRIYIKSYAVTYIRDFEVSDDLNGNNGSWTNSDDTKKGSGNSGKTQGYAVDTRAKKEAKNKQHGGEGGLSKTTVDPGPKRLTAAELEAYVKTRRAKGKDRVIASNEEAQAFIESITTDKGGKHTSEFCDPVTSTKCDAQLEELQQEVNEADAELKVAHLLEILDSKSNFEKIKNWKPLVHGVRPLGGKPTDCLGTFCVLDEPNEIGEGPNGGVVGRLIDDDQLVAECLVTGILYPCVSSESMVENVTDSHVGYFVKWWPFDEDRMSRGTTLMSRSVIAIHIHPDCKLGEVYFKAEEVEYYPHVLLYLNKTFPTAESKIHNFHGCLATLQRRYSHLDPGILVDTINVLHFERHLSLQRIMDGGIVMSVIGDETMVIKQSCNDGLADIVDGDFSARVMQSTECEMEHDWKSRKDLKKISICGKQVNMETFTGELVFPDNERLNPLKKTVDTWCETQYFDVHGDRRFTTYGNTPNNLCKALKRLFGARDGELEYHRNQQEMLAFLTLRLGRSVIHFQMYVRLVRLLKTMGVQVIFELNNWGHKVQYVVNGTEVESFTGTLTGESYNPQIKFMVDKMIYWISLGHRGQVEKFFDVVKTKQHWLYHEIWDKYLTTMSVFDSRLKCAELIHIKRELRKRYVKGVKIHNEEDVLVQRIKGKVKRELAKVMKVPRIYADYGAGSMYSNELPEFFKLAVDGEHCFSIPTSWNTTLEVVISIMAKPRRDSLEQEFTKLIEAVDRRDCIHVSIYSDDMCMSGNINGHQFAVNVDISACDSSNRELVFSVYAMVLGGFHEERALGIVEQCTKPIILVNPYNEDQEIVVEFDTVNEGSGSSATTGLNHSASFLDACATIWLMANYGFSEYHFAEGPRSCGHKVTIQSAFVDGEFIPEKLQLLKHSPIQMVGQGYKPMINLGCLLRSLGRVDYKITFEKLGVSPEIFKRMTESEKMDRFFSGVISGMVHVPSCSILRGLRDRFTTKSSTVVRAPCVLDLVIDDPICRKREFGEWTNEYVEYGECVVDELSLCRRYDITPDDLDYLATSYSHVRLGSVIKCDALTQIYNLDYDL
jgi:hypothetical protein